MINYSAYDRKSSWAGLICRTCQYYDTIVTSVVVVVVVVVVERTD